MLRSLMQRFRHSKIVLLLMGAAILTVVFMGFGLLGTRRSSRVDAAAPAGGAFEVGLNDSRKVAGFVESYGQRIDQAERRLAERENELKTLHERLSKQDTALGTLLAELERARAVERPAFSDPRIEPAAPAPSLPRLTRVTLAAGRREADSRAQQPFVHIPAGSFAEATLLTGVYAPTTGGALPVQMRVDMVMIGPNRARIPIQGAFLIGKAEGDANSTRAVIQLDRLSYVTSDGRSVEVPANGYVVDEDGVQGLGGTYVWRIQEAASMAMVTGGISAVADAAAQRETTTQLNPLGGATKVLTGDVTKFSLSRGASRAAETVEKILERRLEEIVPAIHVPNGRHLTVVLIEGVTLPGVKVNEVTNAASGNPYAGLDFDR